MEYLLIVILVTIIRVTLITRIMKTTVPPVTIEMKLERLYLYLGTVKLKT